eukprot:GHVL01021029.1.p1 GENE.GHVL01021029.1~~GHVL01021029.1.p1  ORF type:complete len:301 (+),score=51.06 GHVL01021029.1:95-997(+)
MHIKSVTIRGFKTYKEATTLGDLSPNCNVIVGLNGSGKSNLFHAIMFVLSEELGTINSTRRRELLHEGTGSAVTTAFVEVIFNNSDKRLPIEQAEVSIRRSLGKSGEEWLLDNKKSTRTEVMNLLETAGFSKANPYYIVRQGKIASLTTMTDAARLGLLKEVAGTKIYDQKRQDASKSFEESRARRAAIETKRSEVKNRIQALEAEQKELRECTNLERQRRAIEYTLSEREWQSAHKKLEILLDTKQRNIDCRNKEASEVEQLKCTRQQLEIDVETAQGELFRQKNIEKEAKTSLEERRK